jgi:hypothetical protein
MAPWRRLCRDGGREVVRHGIAGVRPIGDFTMESGGIRPIGDEIAVNALTGGPGRSFMSSDLSVRCAGAGEALRRIGQASNVQPQERNRE